MRNLKRVLSLALALVMVLGMMVIGTSAATFTDAEEITYKEAVDVMAELGILQGYNGTFNPKGDLNRAGAAKLIAYMTMGAEADNYLTGSAAPFTDVAADHWAAKYVAYCSNLKIINGNGDGTFNPDGKISVVGFAKLVLGAIEAEGTFTGAGWEEAVKKAFNAVPELKATGIKVTTANITREEASALMLAGMKAGEAYSKGYYIEGHEEFGYSDSYADAYIMAIAMKIADPVILKHSDKHNSLLKDVYGVQYIENDKDIFGRPGVGYEKEVDGKKVVDLYFQDEAAATYVNTFSKKVVEDMNKAANKDLFAGATIVYNGYTSEGCNKLASCIVKMPVLPVEITTAIVQEHLKNENSKVDLSVQVGRVAMLAVAGDVGKLDHVICRLVDDKKGTMTITGTPEKDTVESVQHALLVARIMTDTIEDTRSVYFQVGGLSIPKAGGSVGLSAFIAALSAIRGIAVPGDVCFTGVVDLNGAIGEVGGIDAKLKAAQEAGCTKVFLPAGCVPDHCEQYSIELVPVSHVDDVVHHFGL